MFLAFLVIGFFLAWLLGHVIAGILKIKYVTDAMKEDKKQKQEQEQKQQMPPPQAEQDKDYFLEQEQAALHKLIKTLDNQFEEAKTERERVQILSKQATALRRLNAVTEKQYKLWQGWDNF